MTSQLVLPPTCGISLRSRLEDAAEYADLPLKALTVLAPQNDPFRIDTPASHRDGEWLAITARELGLGNRQIHLRGLHYMLLGRTKPNGVPYTNTEADWTWLSVEAAKAARWLGYIPFDQITDQRNSQPITRLWQKPHPEPEVEYGADIYIPDVDEVLPHVSVGGFEGSQPYKLVFIGEKSSLDGILGPLASHYQADLYLPTGEISDTLIYHMARLGAEDGRPMVVFYVADCDPAGWQMAISVSRKLQAFESWFPGMKWQLHRVALTPEQVGEYGLPSTPLKDTEKRADKWMMATEVAQTEIDALMTLRPNILRELVRDAVAPFFDETLAGRVFDARSQWLNDAEAALEDHIGDMGDLREIAAEQLADLRSEVQNLNRTLEVDVEEFELPPFDIPNAEVDGWTTEVPLCDSNWDFDLQCEQLKNSKEYR